MNINNIKNSLRLILSFCDVLMTGAIRRGGVIDIEALNLITTKLKDLERDLGKITDVG